MNTEEHNQTIAAAENAVSQNPTDFEKHVDLGMAYFHTQRFDEAMTAFHRAIEINPNAATAYNGIGRVHYHTGPAEKAVEAYTQAFSLDRHYVDAYFGLGVLYFAQLGEFEAAVETFHEGLLHNPEHPFLIASLGNTYARMGRFDEALASLQQAIRLDPESTYALGNLSIVYLHLRRYDEMIATCQREIEIADDHSARRMLGYVYDWLDRPEEAIAQLEQAVALEPQDYEARGALARVLRGAGRAQDAQAQYTIASEMAAQDDEYGQSCFHAVSGNVEEALRLLEIGLDKGQVQKGWIRIDPEFAFLYDNPRFNALIEDEALPQSWHYGIIAQHWAEFQNYNADGPDVAYYRKFIEQDGQPALDVACGTGRLLLPYLRAGLDVDGCDISPDMLAHCREKAEREGFSPTLYAQAMHELHILRAYRTIFVCGSFGIGSTRQQDALALRRFYEHLTPGGVLLLDHRMAYGGGSWFWKDWLAENRRQLDPDFWTEGERERASDGSDFVMRFRLADIDPLEQVLTLQYWAQRWQGEELLGEEKRTLTSNIYFKNELVMLLKQAGFDEVTVQGDYTNVAATPEHDDLVFIARKSL